MLTPAILYSAKPMLFHFSLHFTYLVLVCILLISLFFFFFRIHLDCLLFLFVAHCKVKCSFDYHQVKQFDSLLLIVCLSCFDKQTNFCYCHIAFKFCVYHTFHWMFKVSQSTSLHPNHYLPVQNHSQFPIFQFDIFVCVYVSVYVSVWCITCALYFAIFFSHFL